MLDDQIWTFTRLITFISLLQLAVLRPGRLVLSALSGFPLLLLVVLLLYLHYTYR